LAVAYCTVTGNGLAAESVTVNTALLVPELPSTLVTSAMVNAGGVGTVMVALVASLVKPPPTKNRASY